MPRPVTKVEIAFNVGVTGTPVWTDVTSKVRTEPGISIDHWRGDEDTETGPSRCSFVLLNNDGRYTPGNASSPHYPNVKRNRPIRVRSTHNGVTYDRFNGYIDNWGVDWPATVGTISDCSVSATSRQSRLARGTELRSVIEEEIALDSPGAYYTMGDPSGSLVALDSSGNVRPALTMRGRLGSSVAFGSATGPATDSLTAAEFAGVAEGKFLGADLSIQGTSRFWVECWFNTSDTVGGSQMLVQAAGPDLDFEMYISNTTGRIITQLKAGVGSMATPNPPDYRDGQTHHVAAWFEEAGGTIDAELYVDGELVATDSDAGSLDSTVTSFYVGGDGQSEAGGLFEFAGTLAHVAVGTNAIDPARFATHAAAGSTGFAGETPADRIERYASYVAVDPSDLNLDTGVVALSHIDTTNMTALAAMRQVETAEGGVLFDALDGSIAFHDRTHRYTASSAFTVSYASGQVAGALQPVLDDQFQVNDMTATNAEGVAGRQFDQASINEDGYYRDSVDLATNDPDEPLMRAGWTVGRYAEAMERISSLEILLNTSSNTLVAGVLSAQVGTKFTLTGLPANAPASSMVLFVEGRTELITMNEDRVSFHTSPAELFDVWTVGDAEHGAWDETPIAY